MRFEDFEKQLRLARELGVKKITISDHGDRYDIEFFAPVKVPEYPIPTVTFGQVTPEDVKNAADDRAESVQEIADRLLLEDPSAFEKFMMDTDGAARAQDLPKQE